MSAMNISLPEALRAFVDTQVSERGHGSSGEYVRELILAEQDRQHLRGLLLGGAGSPTTAGADVGYFAELRLRAQSRPTT
jgi:antitoxin ParD1/3/4